jgi:hypothetical protein
LLFDGAASRDDRIGWSRPLREQVHEELVQRNALSSGLKGELAVQGVWET